MAGLKDPFTPRDFPDHHDAELVLRLYEMRREQVMRESRAAIARDFFPRSIDELMDLTKTGAPLNAPFRQMHTYWEMAYSMARYGIVNADFLMESSGEGMFLLARVRPFLAEYRERSGNARAFANAEWVADESAVGKETYARMRRRVEQLLAAR